MLSDCRLFTCGTCGIVFYSSRSPAPFSFSNAGKIDFSYIGESKLCWAARRVEHDPTLEILERNETGYKAEFFWSLYTQTLTRTAVNERMEFPRAYVRLLRSLGSQNMKQ